MCKRRRKSNKKNPWSSSGFFPGEGEIFKGDGGKCPLLPSLRTQKEPLLQSISSTFYEQLLDKYFCTQKLQSQTVTREKLSYEKCESKILIKLIPCCQTLKYRSFILSSQNPWPDLIRDVISWQILLSTLLSDSSVSKFYIVVTKSLTRFNLWRKLIDETLSTLLSSQNPWPDLIHDVIYWQNLLNKNSDK
jgi:hypothetical protein